MPQQFLEFQQQVEAVKTRYMAGEISEIERNDFIRQMNYHDTAWDDVWMLSPKGEWFRKATGSKVWIRDYPIALIDPDTLPPITEMNAHQVARVVHDCTRCGLHEGRKRAVPGEGPVPADIMLIGEGPGATEDQQARPFVGASGKFLDELLAQAGYKRAEVFIGNVVKCRPPNNRDPQPDELAACKEYLDRQVELVQPKVIVTLGRFSMYRYFPGASITKIHGQSKRVGDTLIVPMFHPAAALRNPAWRALLIEDFQKLPALVKEATSFRQPEPPAVNTTQLSMF